MSLNKAFYGVKIGINGAGRIGRLACRACLDAGMIVSAFNDPFCSVDYLAYLLKHDSTHGKLDHTVVADKDAIVIDGNRAVVFAEREPSNIPWGNAGVELVLECTGVFTTKEGASKHIHDTVKKVIISAPSKDAPMFVWGVNQDKYDAKTMDVISNASCTTNCLAPLVKVIDAKWGLHQGLMTTIHAVTNTQPTVDGMSKKDWRGGRSALCNIIPASTGAAVAVGHVLPEVAGKLTGMAFRVPTVDVSVVDLTAELIRPIEGGVEEIKATFKEAADTYLNGIMSFTDEDVVSTDFLSTTYTCNFDAKATILLNPTFAKFVAWYDNERGYATKLVRLAAYVAAMMQEE